MVKKILLWSLCLSLTAAGSACAAAEESLPDTYPFSGSMEDAYWISDLTDFSASIYGSDEYFTQDNFADYDVTMINFWAPWCGPCVAEMPDLAEFAASVPDNIQVITACVGPGTPDEIGEVLNYAEYEGITLYEFYGQMAPLINAVSAIPTTLFFDSEGRAVGSGVVGGVSDFREFYTEQIDEILTAMGLDTMSETGAAESETEVMEREGAEAETAEAADAGTDTAGTGAAQEGAAAALDAVREAGKTKEADDSQTAASQSGLSFVEKYMTEEKEA